MTAAERMEAAGLRESSENARAEVAERRNAAHDVRQGWQVGLYTTARVFVGLVFVASGTEKLLDFSGTVASLNGTLIDVHRLIPGAIAIELALGVLLVTGWQTRVTACVAIAYVLVAVLLLRPDLSFDLGRAVALANLGFVAALLTLAAHGAGKLSVDHMVSRRRRLRTIRARRAAARASVMSAASTVRV